MSNWGNNTRRDPGNIAFTTPELCEQILLSGLSSYDLLKLMSVNKQFHNTILGSRSILKAIGLVADYVLSPYTPFPGPRMRRHMNVFHEALDQPISHGALRVSLDDHGSSRLPPDDRAYRHWFEAYFEPHHGHSSNNNDVESPGSLSVNRLLSFETRLKIGTRVRTLLVTQPPIKRLSTFSHCGTMVTNYYPNGVCVGDLYDSLQEILAKCRTRGCSCFLEPWIKFAERHRSPKVYFVSGPFE
jgi:hypothetical protein